MLQSLGSENIGHERPLLGLLAPRPVLSLSRITLENNGKIRPQPDRENAFARSSGGESGIRTRETVSRLHAFQACAFDHSATSPVAVSYRGVGIPCKIRIDFRNGHCEVNNLFSIQIQSLDFLSNIIRHTKTPRRRWSSRRSSLAFAVHRMRVQDHFAGIMLPSVVGAGPPHHAWSVGSRVPISNGVLVLAGGTSDSTASSRPRPGEGTTEDRDHPDPIHGQVSFRAKAW